MWDGLTARQLEMIYAIKGRVTFQDQASKGSFLDHPNRDGLLERMKLLNRGR